MYTAQLGCTYRGLFYLPLQLVQPGVTRHQKTPLGKLLTLVREGVHKTVAVPFWYRKPHLTPVWCQQVVLWTKHPPAANPLKLKFAQT